MYRLSGVNPAIRQRAHAARSSALESLGYFFLVLALVASADAEGLEAQVVEGRVLDRESSEPIATVRVSLITGDDEYVGTALTDADGWFRIRAPEPGAYALEADRLGYGAQRIGSFDVSEEGVTRHDFPLTPRAVEVEGIEVDVYPGQLLHDADLAGVYARRARSPSVGSNRVLVRDDPELEGTMAISDLLPAPVRPLSTWSGRKGWCGYLYVDGRDVAHMGAEYQAAVLSWSPREVHAVEYYRDHNSTPMSLRPMEEPGELHRIRDCGLLAVWTPGAPR